MNILTSVIDKCLEKKLGNLYYFKQIQKKNWVIYTILNRYKKKIG